MEKSERTGRISSSQLNRTVPSVARWQVRKAETYIEANWDQPSTIEALARVTEPSARALFHSFRKARGYSPMDFAKRPGLDRARRMLAVADPLASVTTAAFGVGFSKLGHSCSYYRRAFGEAASVTLHRCLHTVDGGS